MAQRRRFTIRNPFVSEMTDGKQPQGYGVLNTLWAAFFKHRTTIDYTRNNYDLFKSLYYASKIGDVDESMLLGAGFAKPIVNSTVAFAIGSGFNISIAGADENAALKEMETDLQHWIDTHYDQIYDYFKYGTRDGDGYTYIDELGHISQLKPETVDVVVDAISGELRGFNIEELAELTDPTTGTKKKIKYLKQYRTTFTRITQMDDNQTQEQGKIIYERIFTSDGDIDTQATDNAGNPIQLDILQDELEQRPLPIVHYRNEPEPGALYGNSELQNVLVYLRNYGETLDEATKREIYNSKPVLFIKGIASDPADDPRNADSYKTDPVSGEKQMDWQQSTTLYAEDSGADAKFLAVPGGMDNTGKLLEYLFYCIVQASETPEFIFGTAVSSSRASVSEQMPIVTQKAERKRKQMRPAIIELLELYIFRQQQLSNPTYLVGQGLELEIDLEFPPIVDEDKELNVKIVELLSTISAIGPERANEILLGMTGEDAAAEVTKALAAAKAAADAGISITPTNGDRLTNELNGGTGDDDLDQ
jgi:hypothetical protein